MALRINGIEDEDDLRKAQAAAQAQGTSITNYNEWAEIMKNLSEAGVESTGSYAGDKAKMQEIQRNVEEIIQMLTALVNEMEEIYTKYFASGEAAIDANYSTLKIKGYGIYNARIVQD